MKKFLMALAVLAIASAPALAGPNANGTLIVHDTGLAYTVDSSSYPSAAPGTCLGTDIQLPGGLPPAGTAGYVWKVYAAFPTTASPRLKALPMGEAFDANVVVLTGGMPDPVLDFEIPQNGWPTTSGGGDGVSFGVVKTNIINECYWFGGYGYAPGIFAMAPHPVQGMVFVDDQVPPNEDPIVGLSSIGFGVDGVLRCPPEGPTPGACCFADGSCQILPDEASCLAAGGISFLGAGSTCDNDPCAITHTGACCVGEVCSVVTAEECTGLQGTYLGDDVPCDPNPCAVPTEETSWGHIKANYR